MRWLAVFFSLVFSFVLGQSETKVAVKFPAEVVRFKSVEKVDLTSSSLSVFIEENWQLLVSAETTQSRLYAQFNNDAMFPLSELPRATGVGARGWQSITLSPDPNGLTPEKASVTYSLIHP